MENADPIRGLLLLAMAVGMLFSAIASAILWLQQRLRRPTVEVSATRGTYGWYCRLWHEGEDITPKRIDGTLYNLKGEALDAGLEWAKGVLKGARVCVR